MDPNTKILFFNADIPENPTNNRIKKTHPQSYIGEGCPYL
jgi:hypothetical protein